VVVPMPRKMKKEKQLEECDGVLGAKTNPEWES
jgi:hypothetical protein